MGQDILPTGTCFEDVTWHFTQTCMRNSRALAYDPTYRMVHGICHLATGKPYSHAWIEHGDKVWFSGIIDGRQCFLKCTAAEFYAEFQVTETTKYTFWQAVEADQANKGMPPPLGTQVPAAVQRLQGGPMKMNKSQIDRLIGAMGKLSEANGCTTRIDALLCIEEARALAGGVALELEREISVDGDECTPDNLCKLCRGRDAVARG